MSDPDSLDLPSNKGIKAVDVNERVRREALAEKVFFKRFAPVLAACYEALLEEPCEREIAEMYGLDLAWFLHHYRDSYIVPILVGKDRMIAGAMWFHHGDVHLAVKREYRRTAWVKRLPEMFDIGFRAYGPVLLAKINKKNLVARRFTEKLGGVKVAEDNIIITYEMRQEAMTYAKTQKLDRGEAGGAGSSHLPGEPGGPPVLHGPDAGGDDAGAHVHQDQRADGGRGDDGAGEPHPTGGDQPGDVLLSGGPPAREE